MRTERTLVKGRAILLTFGSMGQPEVLHYRAQAPSPSITPPSISCTYLLPYHLLYTTSSRADDDDKCTHANTTSLPTRNNSDCLPRMCWHACPPWTIMLSPSRSSIAAACAVKVAGNGMAGWSWCESMQEQETSAAQKSVPMGRRSQSCGGVA